MPARSRPQPAARITPEFLATVEDLSPGGLEAIGLELAKRRRLEDLLTFFEFVCDRPNWAGLASKNSARAAPILAQALNSFERRAQPLDPHEAAVFDLVLKKAMRIAADRRDVLFNALIDEFASRVDRSDAVHRLAAAGADFVSYFDGAGQKVTAVAVFPGKGTDPKALPRIYSASAFAECLARTPAQLTEYLIECTGMPLGLKTYAPLTWPIPYFQRPDLHQDLVAAMRYTLDAERILKPQDRLAARCKLLQVYLEARHNAKLPWDPQLVDYMLGRTAHWNADAGGPIQTPQEHEATRGLWAGIARAGAPFLRGYGGLPEAAVATMCTPVLEAFEAKIATEAHVFPALSILAERGRVPVDADRWLEVEAFLRRTGVVSKTPHDGTSPLFALAERVDNEQSSDCLQLLPLFLDLGFDPRHTDDAGQTPAMLIEDVRLRERFEGIARSHEARAVAAAVLDHERVAAMEP